MLRRVYGYLLPHKDGDVSPACKTLEGEGFALIRGVFGTRKLNELRIDVSRVFAEDPPDRRAKRPPAADAMFRYAMLNRSAACQRAIAHPQILAAIEPLLGEDCHVIANTAWRNPPSVAGRHGGERWHIDAGPHVPLPKGVSWPADIPHPVFAIGAHIYLQDCGLDEGPTGVIPGSHLSGRVPPADQTLEDGLTCNGVGVTPLLADAGDVALFVSDVWHRRMPTRPGDRGRFFLQVHYGRRDIAQRLHTTAQTNQLSAAAIRRARSDRDKTLIGLHRPGFYDG